MCLNIFNSSTESGGDGCLSILKWFMIGFGACLVYSWLATLWPATFPVLINLVQPKSNCAPNYGNHNHTLFPPPASLFECPPLPPLEQGGVFKTESFPANWRVVVDTRRRTKNWEGGLLVRAGWKVEQSSCENGYFYSTCPSTNQKNTNNSNKKIKIQCFYRIPYTTELTVVEGVLPLTSVWKRQPTWEFRNQVSMFHQQTSTFPFQSIISGECSNPDQDPQYACWFLIQPRLVAVNDL